MAIKDLIRLMWRKILYIILGLVLGAGVGIIVTKNQVPVYEALTKVFVSRTRQQSNSDMLSLSDDQLLAINLQLAKSQPVLNDVSSQLGSKINADNIQVDALPNSLIIQIKVQDNDPQRAATIANLLAQTLSKQNEKLLSGWYTGFETAINEQLDPVQKQIDDLQTQISQVNDASLQEQLTQVNQQIDQTKAEISALDQEIANFPLKPTPLQLIALTEKQAQLTQVLSLMTVYQQIQANLTYIGKPGQNGSGLENPRLVTLQSTLILYQQIHQTLINNRESVRLARAQTKQSVMQIVSAAPPKNPVRPIPILYFLLGGGVGLALAATAILVFDHLDDSLKSADQIEELLGLPVLGLVFENKHTKADAFRALGASLEIIGAGKNVHTVMIVNAGSADAKTNIAANLAVVNALRGKRVILLDGDLKHPHLHSLFGVENQNGFAELLNDRSDIKSARHVVKDVEGMTLIPSGVAENDSTGWLDAEKLTWLLSALQEHADLLIVDSPPVDVADTQILASKMDAVLLAIRAGHTRVDSAQATLKRLRLIGARVAGAVFYRTVQYRKIINSSLLD